VSDGGGDRCCGGNYRKRLAATAPSPSIRASSEAPPPVHSLTRVPSYCDGGDGDGSDPARVSFPAATTVWSSSHSATSFV